MAEAIPHIVWMASPDGATTYFNEQGTEYTGCPRETNYDWNWVTVVHPDDAERAREGWECRRSDRDGVRARLSHPPLRRGVPLARVPGAGQSGIPMGGSICGSGRRPTSKTRKQLELSLRRSEQEALETVAVLQSIEAAAPVGFKLVDRDLRVVRINDTLARDQRDVGRRGARPDRAGDGARALAPARGCLSSRARGETICGLDVSMASADDPTRMSGTGWPATTPCGSTTRSSASATSWSRSPNARRLRSSAGRHGQHGRGPLRAGRRRASSPT